jgi:hypothetical protein
MNAVYKRIAMVRFPDTITEPDDAAERQFFVGDFVERNPSRSKYRRGTITGFAPNGWLRVRAEMDQAKIWKPCDVKLVRRELANLSTNELDDEIERCDDESRLHEILDARIERDIAMLNGQ